MSPPTIAIERFAIEHPTIPLSKSPTSPAWRCSSEDAYVRAEAVFEDKWKQRTQDQGPWDPCTVASLNNLIITKIKLRRFKDAEGLCRKILGEMLTGLPPRHPFYLCVQCNLSACLFLSDQPGRHEEAEQLFNDLLYLTNDVPLEPFKGFFEVLVMVRVLRYDCLVLRESSDGVRDLIKVNDYDTQSEYGVRDLPGVLPMLKKKQSFGKYLGGFGGGDTAGAGKSKLIRKGMGSWRRKIPFMTKDVQEVAHNDPEKTMFGSVKQRKPVWVWRWRHNNRPSKHHSSSDSRLNEMLQLQRTLPPIARVSSLPSQSDSLSILDAQTPLTRVQRTLDPAIGLTHRTNGSEASAQTYHVSRHGSVKLSNTISFEAFATDPTEEQGKAKGSKQGVVALLDSGATNDCISETLREFTGAKLEKEYEGTCVAVDGSPVEVLGYAKLGIRWKKKTFGESASAKIKFAVVRDLQNEMLISAKTTEHFKLRDFAGDRLAPILFNKQSQKSKAEDIRRAQQLKALGKAEADRDAAQRKAIRDELSLISEKDSPLVGGSETSQSRSSTLSTMARTFSSSEASTNQSN